MIESRLRIVAGMLSALVITTPFVVSAQDPRPAIAQQDVAPNARRAQLEQKLQQRTGDLVKRRLALTDNQMGQLQTTNRSFEKQRMDLIRRERETRQALRAEMMAGDGANQVKVGQLLDQSIQLQRQRLDLLQSEQRELGKFLTPVQRAKYFGIQNELRKRAQDLRGGQLGMRRRAGQMRPPVDGSLRR